MKYAVEVFGLDIAYMDRIAHQTGPREYWERRAWTEDSYLYVFDDKVEATMFFYRIRHHANANWPTKISS
jgi:hypothetical protein